MMSLVDLILYLVIYPALISFILYGTCGWSIFYQFRSKEDRQIGALLRGAIAMGPEGWRKESGWGGWQTLTGGIKLHLYDAGDPVFYIGGTPLPLNYRVDVLRAYRAIRVWDYNYKKADKRSKLKTAIEQAERHIEINREALDKLDRRVVYQRETETEITT